MRVREPASGAELPRLGREAFEDDHGGTLRTDRVRMGGSLCSSSTLA